MKGWLVGWLHGSWLVGLLAVWLAGWFAVCLAGWLADWLVGWLLRWLDCRLELFAPGVLRLLACRVVSSLNLMTLWLLGLLA